LREAGKERRDIGRGDEFSGYGGIPCEGLGKTGLYDPDITAAKPPGRGIEAELGKLNGEGDIRAEAGLARQVSLPESGGHVDRYPEAGEFIQKINVCGDT
jgi:hypothetical protein